MTNYKIILFFLFTSNLIGQAVDTPPDINEVLSIAPAFVYVSEDTNWYRIDQENNLNINQYSGWLRRDGLEEGDYYYLLEHGNGYFNIPPLIDGFMLSKIDLQNGNVEWTHRSNYFSGNTRMYSPFLGFLKNTNNDYLEVFNSKSQDDIETILECPFFLCDIYSNVSKRAIDKQTGAFVSETTYEDSLRIIANLDNGVPFREVGGEKLLKYYLINTIDEGRLKTFLNFYQVGENGLTSEEPIFQYEYDTGLMTQITSFAYPPIYLQITPDIGIAKFGKINPLVGEQTTELKLVYFDTSDLPNISVIKEYPILGIVPENQDEETEFVNMFPLKDGVFLTQKANIGNEQVIWGARYDLNGQLVTKIDEILVNEEKFDFINAFTIHNDDLFLVTVKRDVDNSDIDEFSIIKYTREGESEVVGQLTTTDGFEDVTTRIVNFEILDNGDFLFYVRIVYPSAISEFETNATYLIKYDKSVFEISNTEEKIMAPVISVYPNPAHGFFELNLDNNINDYEWKVYDMIGRDVSSKVSASDNYYNVEKLQTGTYNLMITTRGQIVNKRIVVM